MRILVIAGLTALAFSQDSQPRPEIHGTVLEFSTHFPVAGAQVELLVRGVNGERQAVLTTSTDSQGVFDFHPDSIDRYTVRVRAEGYHPLTSGPEILGAAFLVTAGRAAQTGSPMEADVLISNGNRKEETRFLMFRPAQLRGRVVDEETGEPLAKVPVNWVTPNPLGGSGQPFLASFPMLTDEAGEFVLSVVGANYAIQVHPRLSGSAQIQAKSTGEDLKAVDQDFEPTFWPGGREFNPNALLTVDAGGSLNVGVIKMRKLDYYRVGVTLNPANCPPGEEVTVQLQPVIQNMGQQNMGEQNVGRINCGSNFLIRGVAPGSYTLNLSTGLTPQARASASMPFSVLDQNIELSLALSRGVDVEVRIVFPDDVQPTVMNQFTFLVQPIEGVRFFTTPFTPDDQGRFRLINLPRGRESVAMLRAGSGLYLREVRYAGRTLPENAFAVDPSADSQVLELVLDNKPSAITGLVQDNDNPVNKPYIAVAKWPYSDDMQSRAVRRAQGAADGKFQITGLSPGEYHVLAVSDANKERLNEPGVLERLLPLAEKVTLQRGGAQTIQLKLTDPNR